MATSTSTTTTRTLPTPPPVSSFSPRSPSKKDPALKPNPHPYAIKTTSTGILTRSNSSGYNPTAAHHYYIPPSPTGAASHARTDSKGHRSSKSLTSVPESPSRESPRPLPIPPELDFTINGRSGSSRGGYVSADEVSILAPKRTRRADTLPVFPSPAVAPAPAAPSVDDLPDNPKLWTPSQLATYLTTALRMTSSGRPGDIEDIGLPPLVAKDIAQLTKSARIGGRTFLRLNEEDLVQLGMNKKWRDALLAAARNLRQNVLKGRIWGGADSPAASAPTTPSPPTASPPTTPSIFANPALNASSSSVDSSSSISADEDGEVEGAALGRSRARRYRHGRVRGMVETFERSGSFSSEGGLDEFGAPGSSPGPDPNPSDERSKFRTWTREEAKFTGRPASGTGSVGSRNSSASVSPERRRPLPVPPSPSGSASASATAPAIREEEEPTMEALLARLPPPPLPLTGAEAWEAVDLAAGVTVKRVPETTEGYAHAGVKTLSGLGSGHSSGGSSKGKPERRVVTAIFAPTPTPAAAVAAASGAADGALKALEASVALAAEAEAGPALTTSPEARPLPVPPSQPQSRAGSPSKRPLPPTPGDAEAAPRAARAQNAEAEMEQMMLEKMLEDEILATRALLETFRARLEVVEEKVADLEAREVVRAEVEAVERERERERATEAMEREREREQEKESVEAGVQARFAQLWVDAETQSESDDGAPPSSLRSASDAGPPPSLSTAETSTTVSTSDSSSSVVGSATMPGALASFQAALPDVVRRLHAPASSLFPSSTSTASEIAKRDGEDALDARQPEPEPSTVSDLPSYVLLVGLGVCAVVVQVVLRRVVGRRG